MFILKTSISPKAFFLDNPVAWLTATGGELKELANKKVPGFLKQSLTTVTGEGLSGLGVLELLTSTKRNSWGYLVILVGLGLGGSGFVLQRNLDTNKKEETNPEIPIQETLFVTPEVAPGVTEALIVSQSSDTGIIPQPLILETPRNYHATIFQVHAGLQAADIQEAEGTPEPEGTIIPDELQLVPIKETPTNDVTVLDIKGSGDILNNTRKPPKERKEHGEKLKSEFQKDRKRGEIITPFIHALLKEDPTNDKVKNKNNEIRRFALDTLIKFLDAEITEHNKDRIMKSFKQALESDKITDKAFKLELEKTLKALLKSPLTNRVFPYKSHEED